MGSLTEEHEWRAALSALLDGEDPSRPIAAIAAHLASCEACSSWLDRATTVNAELRTLPILQPDLRENVVNAVDVRLCACRTGGDCRCADCQCGPTCTCRHA